MRRRLPVVLLSLAGALVLAGAAGAAAGDFAPVEPNSPNAENISHAYWLIVGVAGAIFLLVEGALILFIVRYRRGDRPTTDEGPQVHGANRLEIAWTVVPVLILAGIAGFVFYKLPGIEDVPAASAGERLEIEVESHQFYWLFRYPDGRESINLLEVPEDRVVTLDITAHDVIHSWWVPALGGKIDAIPGRTTHTWFRAERPGTFAIRCTEFCGLQHQAMRGFVRVLPAGREPEQARVGRQAFLGVCAPCHGFRGEGMIGPAIAGSAVLADEEQLRQLLREGQGQMPAVGRTWDAQLMSSTIGYLRSRFAAGQGGQGGTGGGQG